MKAKGSSSKFKSHPFHFLFPGLCQPPSFRLDEWHTHDIWLGILVPRVFHVSFSLAAKLDTSKERWPRHWTLCRQRISSKRERACFRDWTIGFYFCWQAALFPFVIWRMSMMSQEACELLAMRRSAICSSIGWDGEQYTNTFHDDGNFKRSKCINNFGHYLKRFLTNYSNQLSHNTDVA